MSSTLVPVQCDCPPDSLVCPQGRTPGVYTRCTAFLKPENLAEPETEHKDSHGIARKDHYGSGKQPWDVMVELGIAPGFAAGNVLKYLRRSKAAKHSEESARWYYRRLRELAAAPPNDACAVTAPAMLHIVDRELTGHEHLRLMP